jgi:uncharacterized protein (TIGR02246 family)
MILMCAALCVAAFCISSGQESPTAPRPDSRRAKPAPRAAAQNNQASAPRDATKPPNAAAAKKPADKSPDEKQKPSGASSSDETGILKTAESFIQAYEKGDAKAAAAHFTADAEYIDEDGDAFIGREEIEQNFARFFGENDGAALEIKIDSIRFVDPAVAIEDGTTTIRRRDGSIRAHNRYVAVHTKSGGKWLVATVRENAPKGERRHREQLQQLDWLVGEWLDEADESIVTFTCRPVDDGNFLLREFTVTVAGDKVISGSQRIGWDPITSRLRAWTFDSLGGHFEGVWHRDGDSWVLNSTGVTADGETASGTSIFTFVNAHRMTWQAVNLEIEGARTPDSELYTLVRVGPAPDVPEREESKVSERESK